MTGQDPEHDTFIDTTLVLASLPRRLTSTVIDGALVGAVAVLAALPIAAPPLSNLLEPDAWARWVESGAWIPFVLAAIVLAVIMQGALPRSPGKLLTGLELARTSDGAPPPGAQRWLRAGLALVTNAPGLLGTAWIIADPRQRALYDWLSGHVVVVRSRRVGAADAR